MPRLISDVVAIKNFVDGLMSFNNRPGAGFLQSVANVGITVETCINRQVFYRIQHFSLKFEPK
ncbi:hypothetical protein DXN05_22120 [Deminuibacter soli]|uniref:Uncharacterized protein n=1 Tax=Deminuibacter soli TaxID=2291815 RepID=A0A3E1NDG1_9BACT|nr:hypothetical protein DXN05_22120 [Deminuibacter soli]